MAVVRLTFHVTAEDLQLAKKIDNLKLNGRHYEEDNHFIGLHSGGNGF